MMIVAMVEHVDFERISWCSTMFREKMEHLDSPLPGFRFAGDNTGQVENE